MVLGSEITAWLLAVTSSTSEVLGDSSQKAQITNRERSGTTCLIQDVITLFGLHQLAFFVKMSPAPIEKILKTTNFLKPGRHRAASNPKTQTHG